MPVLLAATSATKDPADGYLVKDIISILASYSFLEDWHWCISPLRMNWQG